MAVNAWRDLVDTQRLTQWMDARALGSGPIEEACALTGGTQSILISFRRERKYYVLRRPPAHPILDGSQTMRREARVLAALADTDVPHPRLIAACDDMNVLGAGFYLMEPVDGFSPTVGLPASYADSPDARRRMGLAMVDALVRVSALDHVALGLADFGKLDDYIARQIARWNGQLAGYQDFAGWPGPAGLCGLTNVSNWLEQNRPVRFHPGIVHGDYSLGNVMFRRDAVAVAAIVDWELATLGDPLVDLGWLLATWPDSNGVGLISKLEVHPWQGFLSAQELTAYYAQRSGRDMTNLRWFSVLACFKLAILLEGTHARAHAGKAPMDVGLGLHKAAIKVLVRALEWIEKSP